MAELQGKVGGSVGSHVTITTTFTAVTGFDVNYNAVIPLRRQDLHPGR
jgi:hypothetical protein